MTASDHTFASYRKPLDTGVSINGLNRGKVLIHNLALHRRRRLAYCVANQSNQHIVLKTRNRSGFFRDSPMARPKNANLGWVAAAR